MSRPSICRLRVSEPREMEICISWVVVISPVFSVVVCDSCIQPACCFWIETVNQRSKSARAEAGKSVAATASAAKRKASRWIGRRTRGAGWFRDLVGVAMIICQEFYAPGAG